MAKFNSKECRIRNVFKLLLSDWSIQLSNQNLNLKPFKAFIELINEGRLFSSAMKDHAVRVGNEAEFILNRARADDVKRQADAEMQHAQLIGATKREESACATLISAARRRDALQGSATARRALQALTNPSGCWHRAETDKGGYKKVSLVRSGSLGHNKKLCYLPISNPGS